ncbi:hypothetical protein CL633_02940 [bacterium]|nr:hypothetical protein [bacterium]|tara:strand:- start:467 stop:1177 length:711 start_codon:yes stop_codon:yes gene_type:complete
MKYKKSKLGFPLRSKLKDMPKILRPREKLIAKGPEALSDSELLAIMLGSGYKGKNVKELARLILRRFKLKGLITMSFKDLIQVKGIGQAKATQIKACFELAKRAFNIGIDDLPLVNSPAKALEQASIIRKSKKENFLVLYLNARQQLLYKEIISIGSINMNLVHPREVFQPAIERLAVNVIFIHNHPSGDPEPSEADIKLNADLLKAGDLLGITVLDHLIITHKKFISLREKGLFD